MYRSVAFILCLLNLSLFLAGCTAAPTVPLPFLSYRCDDTVQQHNLLVLLRGYGADNTIFAKEGIIDEIRDRRLSFDVIASDFDYGHYQSQTFETRLKEDIIDPACLPWREICPVMRRQCARCLPGSRSNSVCSPRPGPSMCAIMHAGLRFPHSAYRRFL